MREGFVEARPEGAVQLFGRPRMWWDADMAIIYNPGWVGDQ